MIQNRKSELVLKKAAIPVVEVLERRQLLSQTISLSGSLEVFNAVNGQSSQIETETITNTGNASLTLGVGSTTLANDPAWPTQDSARFSILNGSSVPATLAPGNSFSLNLQYSATSVTTNSAYLNIASDDPTNPTKQVLLRGIGTKGLGGSNQPSLATILQAYNIPTLVGDGPNDANALQDNTYPYPPDPSTQEVVLQRLVKAGTGPVTINVLASFTASGTHPYTLGTYTPGDPTGLSQLFTTPASEYQSVYVQPQGVTTFDPGSSSFGFYCISNVQQTGRLIYSEDALNTFDSTSGRHFRFFPMEQANGTVVPNQFIMTSTEWNAPVGYDFTNIVAIISNVQAAPNAPSGPVLGLKNVNALPGSNTLVFNNIVSPNTSTGDVTHQIGDLKIYNTGGAPLILSSYSLSPQWILTNSPPTFPVTVAAGSSLDLYIKFIATAQPTTPYNETNSDINGGGGGVYSGTLTLKSNDPVNPTVTEQLEGWRQLHSENDNEPGIQTIVNLLFDWGTEINNHQATTLNENINTSNSKPTYYGQEVVSSYWQLADPSISSQVTEIAGYHTEGNTSTTYWYTQGSPGSTHKILEHGADDGQTILPLDTSGSNVAAGTISTSTTFGIKVDTLYSDDSLNTGSSAQGGGHHMRFYPIYTAAGVLVPNDYILAFDYATLAENFDFQDTAYVITNIRPVTTVTGLSAPLSTGAPPAPADFYATAAATGNLLQWAPVTYGSLEGYNVYRAAAAAGPYTLLTSSPISAFTYADTAAPTTGISYYKVAAVDSTTQAQSLMQIASVVGSGTVVPGSPVASAENVTTGPASPITINVASDATDATGTIVPGSVVITSPPLDGTASVNSVNGAITYTPNLGFAGSDTLQYTISDNTGAVSTPGLIAVTVSAAPVGDPVAVNLSFTTNENIPVTITNIPASASDNMSATIDPTTVAIVIPPTHGTATVNASNGTVIYTPTSGYSGSDSFQYTIGDSLLATSPPATVSLSIVHAAPVAANITAAPVAAGGVTSINVLSAATDSGATINPASVTISTEPANGTAAVNSTTGVITYTPNLNFVGADSLQYTVADSSGIVSVPATISLSAGIAITSPAARSLAFVDSNGSKVKLSLTGPGTDLIFFNGAGTYSTAHGIVTVAGAGLSISSMNISNTSLASTLIVTRTGIAPVALSDVAVQGPLGRFLAATSALAGTFTVSGSMTLLQLASATGSSISIGNTGATAAGLTLIAGPMTNTDLTCSTPIRAIRVSSWTEMDGSDGISAPSITSLIDNGNFQAALTTTGGVPYSLTGVRIIGQISSDAWSIGGNAASISVGSIATGWTGSFAGNITSLVARSGGFAGTLSAANINSLTIIGDDTGSITAGSIRSARFTGSLTGASIVTTAGVSHAADLGRLSVGGAITSSQITSAGNIGPVTAAALTSSSIDAGVATGVTLPSTAADLTASADIATVVLSRGGTFANSNIAAAIIGPLSLGEIITASSASAFGIAADTIRALTASLDTGGVLRLNATALLSASSVAAYESANSLTLNSFVIRPGL